MTIKESIEQIKNNLNSSYSKLQELKYEEEIEHHVRVELLYMISITKNIFNFIYSHQEKQENNKRQGAKR